MPSVLTRSPSEFRRLVEEVGYQFVGEDPLNWWFEKTGANPLSVIIPHTVKLVPLGHANYLARKVIGIQRYISS